MKCFRLRLIGLAGIAILFVSCATGYNHSTTGQTYNANKELIKAGKEKAKELGLNPILAYIERGGGNIILVKGTEGTIINGEWVLVDGDIIINVGYLPIPIADFILEKGEYAIANEGKIKKMPDVLGGTEKELEKSSEVQQRSRVLTPFIAMS